MALNRPEDAHRRRAIRGQRWINIGLRGLHLVGVAGMGAGFLVHGPPAGAWHPYLILTLATGLGMMLLDAWSDRDWLRQTYGQATLIKLLLLAAIPFWPAAAPALFVVVILFATVLSHAPAWLRHGSLFDGSTASENARGDPSGRR